MQKLITILLVHSLKDLFKHKSFFLLIFILAFADRGLKILKNTYNIELGMPSLKQLDIEIVRFIFEQLPGVIAEALMDFRVFAILIGLFFFKQIISLWPSSDMRRMHRRERGHFGIWASLAAIRWQQIVWDAIALATLCSLIGVWCLVWFLIHRLLWWIHPSLIWGISLGAVISIIFPMVLAGFSYSSKLAVISKGRFREKLALFYKLFTDIRLALWSWLFYAARLVVEVIFVAAIPAYILLTMDIFWLRILLAAALATPVYSYIKMASFKFFLVVYERFELVRQEYQMYYRMLTDMEESLALRQNRP